MTTKTVTVLGRTFPANTLVVISPGFTHYCSEYWKNPSLFNPNRFLKDQEVFHSNFKWIPFGSGSHKCIGLHFSNFQAKVLLKELLKKFKIISTTNEITEWIHMPFPRPKQSFGLHALDTVNLSRSIGLT